MSELDDFLEEPRNPCAELAEAMGLNPNDITDLRIGYEMGTAIVTVTSVVYLTAENVTPVIECLKQYRLVAIADEDTRPLSMGRGATT